MLQRKGPEPSSCVCKAGGSSGSPVWLQIFQWITHPLADSGLKQMQRLIAKSQWNVLINVSGYRLKSLKKLIKIEEFGSM